MTETIFDSIKHFDDNNVEFWFARELQSVLQYAKWGNFHKVIKTAMIACKISQHEVEQHFPEVRKLFIVNNGAKRYQIDYKLTRYACYLIVMRSWQSSKRNYSRSWRHYAGRSSDAGQKHSAVGNRHQEKA